MINQQLLDYIKQQMQQGVSREKIKISLMANGWQAQDIEEGFNNINTPNIPSTYPAAPIATSSSVRKIIAGIVIGIAILGGGAYFASQTIFKSEEIPKVSNEVSNQPSGEETPINTITLQRPSEQPTTQTQPQNPEIVFADKLSSCTKYKTTFKHPLSGDMLEKEILGIMGGKCNYIEQMPNSGKMECKYSESERITIAQYYKDVANAESVDTSLRVDSQGQQTKYTINGREVENPLQEAINSGVCVIFGY